MGNEAWTLSLDWAGGNAFRNAPKTDWTPEGSSDAAGVYQSYGGLTFLQVYEAGHMVGGIGVVVQLSVVRSVSEESVDSPLFDAI